MSRCISRAKSLVRPEHGAHWPSMTSMQLARWQAAQTQVQTVSHPRTRSEHVDVLPDQPLLIDTHDLFEGEPFWTHLQTQSDALYSLGEGADGDPVLVTWRDFLAYGHSREAAKDRNPLYLFDDSFDCDAPGLLDLYAVPSVFAREDLLSVLPEEDRANWRWLLVGPERSGSSLHVDPVGTSAWNASLKGTKWWVMVEPATPDGVLNALPQAGCQPDTLEWFLEELPRVKRRCEDQGHRFVEMVQGEGETVWVPSGWHHAVLNLSFSVAVTHNMVRERDLARCWTALDQEDSGAAARWLEHLARKRPELSQQIADMTQ